MFKKIRDQLDLVGGEIIGRRKTGKLAEYTLNYKTMVLKRFNLTSLNYKKMVPGCLSPYQLYIMNIQRQEDHNVIICLP